MPIRFKQITKLHLVKNGSDRIFYVCGLKLEHYTSNVNLLLILFIVDGNKRYFIPTKKYFDIIKLKNTFEYIDNFCITEEIQDELTKYTDRWISSEITKMSWIEIIKDF